ncbi:MAG: CCA tRNA nucleotidyltransferase [Kiritimatiellae bacterium]|nr:CCA tRNA nucleotidyltransferase [Kiritimatiellia bacterium]
MLTPPPPPTNDPRQTTSPPSVACPLSPVVSLPPLPTFAPSVIRTLCAAGHEAWLVGGCVRDLLLGRAPHDYDVVTSALPDQIEALFSSTVAVGKAFGIITIVAPTGENVEVATFRSDSAYLDGRHPTSVAFTDARTDVLRRDFTVNALLLDPDTGEIADYVGGRADLAARVIRAIGDPARRFAEDRLRMLRAVRFAAALGFSIDPDTWSAILDAAPAITQISAERIRDELFKTLLTALHPGQALQTLLDSGLLAQFLPEIAAMVGVEQPPEFHPEGDVFVHTRIMLDALPPPGPNRTLRLALAVLFHDVGKPPTAALLPRPDGPPRWAFREHAAVGAAMTEAILQRLRAPNDLTESVVRLVRTHMRTADAPKMRRAKLRALLGDPLFDDMLALHKLDCAASHGDCEAADFLDRVAAEFAAEPALPPPLIRGRDLLPLGYPPGPALGVLLHHLYDLQLEHDYTSPSQLLPHLPPPP